MIIGPAICTAARNICDTPVMMSSPLGAAASTTSTGTAVTVRTPDAARLTTLLSGTEATVTSTSPDLLIVNGITAPRIGELAAAERIVLHELTPTVGSLEDAYMQLTADDVEYLAGGFPTPQEDAR